MCYTVQAPGKGLGEWVRIQELKRYGCDLGWSPMSVSFLLTSKIHPNLAILLLSVLT